MATDQFKHRMERRNAPSLRVLGSGAPRPEEKSIEKNAVVDCGWGRLVFAHTFADSKKLASAICDEPDYKRNISLYIRDPHVVLASAPQDLFLDPSHTYRLWLSGYRSVRPRLSGYRIRKLFKPSDAREVDRILKACGMVPIGSEFLQKHRSSRQFSYFVAEDTRSGGLLGVVTGVDHKRAFNDPENGSSLWCLAVDPNCKFPGVGRALTAWLADHYAARGRGYMDLSVMHDNKGAIKLYESLGFKRVPVFCIKKKNSINEKLFVGPERLSAKLNPYAKIIVDEARRRGISVEILNAEEGYFRLSFGGRSIDCRESLSELTSAVAMSRCDNKKVTAQLLTEAGLRVPEQIEAGSEETNKEFLQRYEAVVVKPERGEQGQGVQVNITDPEVLENAIDTAKRFCDTVLLEQYVQGDDLRVIVIDDEVVAAAVRRPPQITGDGRSTVRDLIEKQSRRRAAVTGGESRIPLDKETERCVNKAGYDMDDVLDYGKTIFVRSNSNLHTGGTIHDVTQHLNPKLREVAETAARTLDIPVTGLDFIVDSPRKDEYVIIEANERPGLANHEPQPTAQRFVDLLFPRTMRRGERHGYA